LAASRFAKSWAATSGLMLRSLPTGPRKARPDDKLRKRLEGWLQRRTRGHPSRRGQEAAPQDEASLLRKPLWQAPLGMSWRRRASGGESSRCGAKSGETNAALILRSIATGSRECAPDDKLRDASRRMAARRRLAVACSSGRRSVLTLSDAWALVS
jgi:hypothetical protein